LQQNGSGTLSWRTITEGDIVSASTGINISRSGQNVTVSNTGVTRIIAGTGINISPTSGTGNVTVTANVTVPAPYPFTTRWTFDAYLIL